MDERTDPQMATDEVTTLTEFLDWYRATLLVKVDGLTDEQAGRRSAPPSTLSLLGLVRHMAEVERSWFRRVWAGEDAPPIFFTDDEPDRDIETSDGDTLAVALDAIRSEVDHAREVVAGHALDEMAAMSRTFGHPNLRWILVHMVEEYARHCGHADLLRQAVDGAVGD